MIVQELSHSHHPSPNFKGDHPHRQSVASIPFAYHSAAHYKRKRDSADPLSSTYQSSHKRTHSTVDARQSLVARHVSDDSEEREDSPAGAGRGPSSSIDGLLQLRDDDNCLSLVQNYRRSLLVLGDDDGEEDEERRASPMSFHCIKRATNISEDSDDSSTFEDPPEMRSRTLSPQEPIEAEHVFSSSLISTSPQSAYSSSSSSSSPDSSSSMWQGGRVTEDAEEREIPEWLSGDQWLRVPSLSRAGSERRLEREELLPPRYVYTGFRRGNSKGAFHKV